MKGIYLLGINVDWNMTVRVGALGEIPFDKGYYIYVGSAQNNLNKRVERHLSKNKKLRWHIDYLLCRGKVNVRKVYFREAGKELECETAKHLSELGEPINGFGSGDCKCKAHLFKVNDCFDAKQMGFEVYE